MIPAKLSITFPTNYSTYGVNGWATGGNDKVAVIKAIRNLTRLGLKESKDMSEKPGPVEITVNPYEPTTNITKEELVQDCIKTLRANGCTVNEVASQSTLVEMLRNAAIEAIHRDKEAVAIELLSMIRREKDGFI